MGGSSVTAAPLCRQHCPSCCSVGEVSHGQLWVMINVACADSFHRNVCVENEDAASELV